MATSSRSKSSSKQEITKEKNENLRQNQPASNDTPSPSTESKILAELEKLRSGNREGHNQTKLSLTKLETSIEELKGEMTKLEKRTTEAEDRISAAEDNGRRYDRAIRYLLRREMNLSAKCEDLQNRTRRNNLRIYRVPEDSEGKDVKTFAKKLIQSVFKPMPDVNLQIESPPFSNNQTYRPCCRSQVPHR